jgi:ParB-like nuclease family protein
MTDMTRFTGEIHPFADRFPMLDDESLKELAEDVAASGLLHPIVLNPAGTLLDGRNRLRACEMAGVDPTFVVHAGDPVALIVSANVRRRQMMPGQVAMATAIGLAERGQRRNGRWKRGTSDIDHAVDIPSTQLYRAGVVLDYDSDRGTDYADQVLTGSTTLNDAYKVVMVARKREQEAADAADAAQREAAEQAARNRAAYEQLRVQAPDLAELVRLEKLGLQEATAAYEHRLTEQREARQAVLALWLQCVDGLSGALAYFTNGYRPPDDPPDNFPSLDLVVERAAQLLKCLEDCK